MLVSVQSKIYYIVHVDRQSSVYMVPSLQRGNDKCILNWYEKTCCRVGICGMILVLLTFTFMQVAQATSLRLPVSQPPILGTIEGFAAKCPVIVLGKVLQIGRYTYSWHGDTLPVTPESVPVGQEYFW